MASSSPADVWPHPALRATINESRPVFRGSRVLITGACGFVGGHLARALHAAGAHVCALDIDASAGREAQINLTGLRDELDMVGADVCDRRVMAQIIRDGQFTHIFHLAAGASTIERALADPYGTIVANTMGFVNIAEGVRLLPEHLRPTLVYASTDKVYGEARELPYTEDTELAGVGIYDASKLCADILAKTYFRALGVPVVVLRMCNLFGPYDLNYNYRLFPKAMRDIFRDGESPQLYLSSLEHFRDYLFIEDAVRAYLHIARDPACLGRIYNLPGAHYSSTPDVLRDIVALVGEMQDEALELDSQSPMASHHWNRSIRVVPSDPNLITISKQHLDGSRIQHETGFEPMTGWKEGLRATADFYLHYFRAQACAIPEAPAQESGFEALISDEGLPIHRLCPQKPRAPQIAAPALRPSSFVREATLL